MMNREIEKPYDPEHIATERFIVWNILSGEQHAKSLKNSKHRHWSNFDVKKDCSQWWQNDSNANNIFNFAKQDAS